MRRRSLCLDVAPAALGLFSLAACVSEQHYDELQQTYQQLQGRHNADEAEVRMLEGRLKVTMTDRILFPSGAYRIEFTLVGPGA